MFSTSYNMFIEWKASIPASCIAQSCGVTAYLMTFSLRTETKALPAILNETSTARMGWSRRSSTPQIPNSVGDNFSHWDSQNDALITYCEKKNQCMSFNKIST